MKSSKQKRQEIKAKRLKRAKKLAGIATKNDAGMPVGSVLADHGELIHNTNTYSCFPLFYLDKAFACKDCGKEEVWTAKQQKWWYEIAKGSINSTAIRYRSCRKLERERKAEARRVHFEGLARKQQSR